MKYRIDILRKYIPIGELPAESCTIKYDATAEIKRGASITCNMDMMRLTVPEFSMTSDRISPVIIAEIYVLGLAIVFISVLSYNLIRLRRAEAET